MKKSLSALTILCTSIAFAKPVQQPIEINSYSSYKAANTITYEHSSLKEAPAQQLLPKRSFSYPTQIVRMEAELQGNPMTCDSVNQAIDDFFVDKIRYDKFFYNTIIYCTYDPATNFATKFMINSYFDPINQAGVHYLEQYLAKHNGKDLLGATFNVESAKGLVVSMNIDTGIEKDQYGDTMLRFKHDNNSHYYANDYDMREELQTDIQQRFFTNDPNLVLPFLEKWFITYAIMYQGVLEKSDYVELQPELIFLMKDEPHVFIPYLRLYFAHHCSRYPNGHCL